MLENIIASPQSSPFLPAKPSYHHVDLEREGKAHVHIWISCVAENRKDKNGVV